MIAIIHRLIERLSRRIAFRRRLPRSFRDVSIYVSPASTLRFWLPYPWRLFHDLFYLAEAFVEEGDLVWDVGANLGAFSFAAARQAGPTGKVLAIEPDMWLAQLVQRSALRQSLRSAPVAVLPIAVSSCLGISALNIAQRGRAANYLKGCQGGTPAGGVRYEQSVMTLTLDWLLANWGKPAVVKIDTETAEREVLQGAEMLLKTARPVILIEVSPENSAAVADLFARNDYELYDFDRYPAEIKRVSQAAIGTLALPKEAERHRRRLEECRRHAVARTSGVRKRGPSAALYP